jgi:hypothetical protein
LLANAVTTRLVTGGGGRAGALAAPGTMRP